MRKTVVALRLRDPGRPVSFLVDAQRAAPQQQMAAFDSDTQPGELSPGELGPWLMQRYAALHGEADLHWLDEVNAALRCETASGRST